MDRWTKKFDEYLSERGLRHSRPREVVAKEFFKCDGHVGIEALCKRAQRIDSNIGIATVYRTLNLLVESGLVLRRDFATGTVAYEKNPEQHHDHLLCTSCRKIVEFHKEEIEKLQDEIASRYGFELQYHKMELYGLCRDCKKKNRAKGQA